jgi:GntR family transcriptional regulator, transcriptional repressor for pyruvate dehydrogenase complex
MSFDLQPLGSGRRADRVFEQLRGRILSGQLDAGARLPNERELASALGVNRASVREAVKRLEFLELVDVVHGQGTFVRPFGGSSSLQLIDSLLRDPRTVTPALMGQLLEFRRDVTLRVIELAALRRSEAQLERARALLTAELAAGDDPTRALAIDLEWNKLLGEATGNLLYQLVSNLFSKLIGQLGPIYYTRARNWHRSHQTHAELLAAVEARDPAAARRVLGEMLEYSETAIRAEVDRLSAAGLIGPAAAGAGVPA